MGSRSVGRRGVGGRLATLLPVAAATLAGAAIMGGALLTAATSSTASASGALTGADEPTGLCQVAGGDDGRQVEFALHLRNTTDETVRLRGARVVGAENLSVRSLGTDDPWMAPGGRVAAPAVEPGVSRPERPAEQPGAAGPFGPLWVGAWAASDGSPGGLFDRLGNPALAEIRPGEDLTVVARAEVADPARAARLEGIRVDAVRAGQPIAAQSHTALIAVPAGVDHPEECHD